MHNGAHLTLAPAVVGALQRAPASTPPSSSAASSRPTTSRSSWPRASPRCSGPVPPTKRWSRRCAPRREGRRRRVTAVTARGRLPFDPITEAMRQWRAHGWDDAAQGMGVVTSVIRAEQILAGRAEEAVRPFGLTFARYEVLDAPAILAARRVAPGQDRPTPPGRRGQRDQRHRPAGAGPAGAAAGQPQRRPGRAGRHHQRGEATLCSGPRRRSTGRSSPSWSSPRPTPTRCSSLLTKLRRRAGDFD